jgi:pyrroline-5-carboxylate reductase
MMSCRFVFIGAGNLATRLSLEFKKKGFIIEQVYSRTDSSAKALALQVNATFTSDPGHIVKGADVYFVA